MNSLPVGLYDSADPAQELPKPAELFEIVAPNWIRIKMHHIVSYPAYILEFRYKYASLRQLNWICYANCSPLTGTRAAFPAAAAVSASRTHLPSSCAMRRV